MQEEIKDIRIVKITDKGQICIPNVARNLAGFGKGTKVSIIVYSDRVEIKPLKAIREDMLSALISEEVLAEAWDTPEEDEIWKEL
jgi:AbrB family looped-hinge helix DNA binding protein